jgi:hypothetical protein
MYTQMVHPYPKHLYTQMGTPYTQIQIHPYTQMGTKLSTLNK